MITKETFITNFVNHFKKTHKEFSADVSLERCVKEEASEIYNKMNDSFNRELGRIIANGANGTHLKYMSKKYWVSVFMRLTHERDAVLNELDRWQKRYNDINKTIEELNASEFWRNVYVSDMCGCRGYIRNISYTSTGKYRVLIWDNNDPKLDAWKDFEPEDFKKFILQYC
jgi:hypothetical protein